MNFLGQDTEAVRGCATAFMRGQTAITQVVSDLTPHVMDESAWRGEDADRFRNTWQSAVLPEVDRILAEFDALSRELEEHAGEQDLASHSEAHLGGTHERAGGAAAVSAQGMGMDVKAGMFSEDPDGDDGLGNGNGDGSSSSTGGQTDHTLTQDDADRIYEEYQVEDDTMTEWELTGWKRKLAELAGVTIPDPVEVTETEAEMLDGLAPLKMKSFNDTKDLAFDQTAQRYGDENGQDPHPGQAEFNDDHADAFRRAYINALQARDLGEDWTTDYWTAHERIPNNDPAREAMDLHNNEVGRRIAEENPGASDAELGDLVEQAVADGEMVVIDQDGRLVPSNSITPAQAGHPDPDAAPMPGHPQERQTS